MSPPSNETSLVGHNGQRLSVDTFVSQYMREKQVSGVVVAIIHHNGPAEFHCFGVTDDKQRYPITPQTLFALGSLSKGVTAEVVTMLVNEGVYTGTIRCKPCCRRGPCSVKMPAR